MKLVNDKTELKIDNTFNANRAIMIKNLPVISVLFQQE